MEGSQLGALVQSLTIVSVPSFVLVQLIKDLGIIRRINNRLISLISILALTGVFYAVGWIGVEGLDGWREFLILVVGSLVLASNVIHDNLAKAVTGD